MPQRSAGRRHICFYFGTLNYCPCGRRPRSCASLLFYFRMQDAFVPLADADCHAPFGTDRRSVENTRSDSLLGTIFYRLVQSVRGTEPFLLFCLFPFQVQSKRVNLKLRSKVSELSGQRTATTLIRRRRRIRWDFGSNKGGKRNLWHPGGFFITFDAPSGLGKCTD